jgi:hypothetical protein
MVETIEKVHNADKPIYEKVSENENAFESSEAKAEARSIVFSQVSDYINQDQTENAHYYCRSLCGENARYEKLLCDALAPINSMRIAAWENSASKYNRVARATNDYMIDLYESDYLERNTIQLDQDFEKVTTLIDWADFCATAKKDICADFEYFADTLKQYNIKKGLYYVTVSLGRGLAVCKQLDPLVESVMARHGDPTKRAYVIADEYPSKLLGKNMMVNHVLTHPYKSGTAHMLLMGYELTNLSAFNIPEPVLQKVSYVTTHKLEVLKKPRKVKSSRYKHREKVDPQLKKNYKEHKDAIYKEIKDHIHLETFTDNTAEIIARRYGCHLGTIKKTISNLVRNGK